ncbi:MAG: hypothetical protein LBT11_00310 [Treponema sp.]|jgi:hypothetical protein|nr:hypothetical protein [Treponema sp.]
MQKHAKVLRLLCSIVVMGLLVLSLSGCWSLLGGGTTGSSGGGGSGSGSSGKPTLTIRNETSRTFTVLFMYKPDVEGSLDNASNLLNSSLAPGGSVNITLGSTGKWAVAAICANNDYYYFTVTLNEVKAYTVAIEASDFAGNLDD